MKIKDKFNPVQPTYRFFTTIFPVPNKLLGTSVSTLLSCTALLNLIFFSVHCPNSPYPPTNSCH